MQYRLEASHGLSDAQRAGIRQLELLCNEHEGLHTKLNWNILKSRPVDAVNDFMVYDGEKLVGFLGLYHFGRPEAEVSAMVHPEYRRQGLFRAMVAEATVELLNREIPDLVFIAERVSPAAKATMQALAAPYDFSEYLMKLTHMPAKVALPDGISVQLPEPADVPMMAALDQDGFGIPAETALAYYTKMVADQVPGKWLIKKDAAIIGKILASFTPDEIYINAFVMAANQRGQGIGGAVLKQFVHHLRERDAKTPIVLEVDVKNETALGLYTRSGFEMQTAIDYYRLKI